MARTTVATFETSAPVPLPPGLSGAGEARGYFGRDEAPLQLHVLSIERGACLRLEPSEIDRLAHVWQGEVEAGGHRLEAGSTLVVEHGASLEVAGRAKQTRIALFAPTSPRPSQGAGGHVHFLPRDRVPRVGENDSIAIGGLHANGKCGTCDLWLNENTLPAYPEAPPPEEANKGVHMHPEDEILFVTKGNIRLGNKIYEAGAALAVTRDTFYGFHPGPDGLSFVTFRPSSTNQIRFAAGGEYVHSAFWDSIGAIPYLNPEEA
jgi:hypothetical protein